MARCLVALTVGVLLLNIVADGQVKPRPVVISERGVAGLNAATVCRISVIAKLFPGLKVVRGVSASEGISFPTIEVRDGRGVLLEIIPDELAILQVLTKRKEVRHAGKGQIGSFYPDVFGATFSDTCYQGSEESQGQIICPAPEANNIRLVFSGPFHLGSPSPTDLRKMHITDIFWTPPSGNR